LSPVTTSTRTTLPLTLGLINLVVHHGLITHGSYSHDAAIRQATSPITRFDTAEACWTHNPEAGRSDQRLPRVTTNMGRHAYSSLVPLNMIPIRARVRQCKPWGGVGWLHDTKVEPSRTPYLPLPTHDNGYQRQFEPRRNHDRTNSFEPFYCSCMILTHSRDRYGGVVHAKQERTSTFLCTAADCGDHASPELGRGPKGRQRAPNLPISNTYPSIYHTVAPPVRRGVGLAGARTRARYPRDRAVWR